jgi:hypothetical protein
VSRSALWPTQSPVQWVLGVLSRGKARPGRDADHSPPSSAEVKNEQELYLVSPCASMVCSGTNLPLLCSPGFVNVTGRAMKSMRMRWARHVARMGKERKVYKVLVGKPEGKRPLGRPRRRREDGIRMDLRETGWEGVDWIRLARSRDQRRAVMNAMINLRVLAPRSWLVS